MKILYTYFHNYPDMPYHTREWVETAAGLGHEVVVLTAIDPQFLKSISWPRPGISVIQVAYPRSKSFLKYFLLLINMRKAIKNALKREKFDLIYERFSFFSLASASLKKNNFVAYAVELNGILSKQIKSSPVKWICYYLISVAEWFVLKKADKIITVTNNIRENILNTIRIDAKKIRVFPNGVNELRFVPKYKKECRALFKMPQEAFVIGYLGTLAPWQGVDILIDSAKIIRQNIPNVFFAIGGGQEPMYSELKRKIEEKNLSEFFFAPGQIHWDHAADFISAFDLAVSLVKYVDAKYEISSLKIFSYMACAKPVIGTNVSGIKELLQTINIGLVCEKDDINSFALAVFNFYKMDEKERDEMGKRARSLILEKYTWKTIVSNTLNWVIEKENHIL